MHHLKKCQWRVRKCFNSKWQTWVEECEGKCSMHTAQGRENDASAQGMLNRCDITITAGKEDGENRWFAGVQASCEADTDSQGVKRLVQSKGHHMRKRFRGC